MELGEHKGAALGGNLFGAVWTRFCNNKAAPTCASCPLHTICPVSALVAPLREENERGQDLPRPYVIVPPIGGKKQYEPGAQLTFGITLFGNIVQLFPYIILAANALESKGLGRSLDENRGRRGRFRIRRMESCNPISAERQVVYQQREPQAGIPTLSLTSPDIATNPPTL